MSLIPRAQGGKDFIADGSGVRGQSIGALMVAQNFKKIARAGSFAFRHL
jgi:hypothetical protein